MLDRIFGAYFEQASRRLVVGMVLLCVVLLTAQIVGLVVRGFDDGMPDVAGGLVGCAVFWTIIIVSSRGRA